MRNMKDSGIYWMGTIPKEWDVKRVKHAFIRKKEKISSKEKGKKL